jgi:hypothetical protein
LLPASCWFLGFYPEDGGEIFLRSWLTFKRPQYGVISQKTELFKNICFASKKCKKKSRDVFVLFSGRAGPLIKIIHSLSNIFNKTRFGVRMSSCRKCEYTDALQLQCNEARKINKKTRAELAISSRSVQSIPCLGLHTFSHKASILHKLTLYVEKRS